MVDVATFYASDRSGVARWWSVSMKVSIDVIYRSVTTTSEVVPVARTLRCRRRFEREGLLRLPFYWLLGWP
jgi:hypothetical protein